jgi:cyclopropane-fatty-acyl-phospholipid synthase
MAYNADALGDYRVNLPIYLAERGFLPDSLVRVGMRSFIVDIEKQADVPDADFAAEMSRRPIAVHTADANAQHYELPPAFFTHFLGPARKYSCCLYPNGTETLAEAEQLALADTAAHADLKDGQNILELGCGWGSLTLWMAERFPGARITAVSNSAPQRGYIEAQARARNLTNITVITADMNVFDPAAQFDRVVSVEMFEHMSNWRPLLTRIRAWLKPDGALFLHVFTHPRRPSYYDPDSGEWMAKYFFAGGIMPSQNLIRAYSDLFAVDDQWRWSGSNYSLTAEHWLVNFDANRAAIDPILKDVYGREAGIWGRRWRMFLLATSESFGWADGGVWGVNHYRLRPVR